MQKICNRERQATEEVLEHKVTSKMVLWMGKIAINNEARDRHREVFANNREGTRA